MGRAGAYRTSHPGCNRPHQCNVLQMGFKLVCGYSSAVDVVNCNIQPDPTYVSGLRLITKVHIFNAMIFIALIPFTRLAHFLVIRPYAYLWRPYQVVRWYRREAPENTVQYK